MVAKGVFDKTQYLLDAMLKLHSCYLLTIMQYRLDLSSNNTFLKQIRKNSRLVQIKQKLTNTFSG